MNRYGTLGSPTELGRARLERQHALPSGVSPERNASQATKEERVRFCTWLRGEIEARNRESPYGQITGGFECEDGGTSWLFRDEPEHDDCEKRAMCNASFEKIEACLRTTFLRPDAPAQICREGKASDACAGLLDCLPYLKNRTLR